MRADRRSNDQIRRLQIKRDYMEYAEGSCLIQLGHTKVICTASLEEGVPQFLRGSGKGWVTAEYSMLPRSCKNRAAREASKGRVSGRTHEIQRLIGRALRSVVDMSQLQERTIWIDCDVIQADGGTRTASITGSFIALIDCLKKMKADSIIKNIAVSDYIAAISVGIVDGNPVLDLTYQEDSKADVDMNVVMTSSGKYVEIQGTAEGAPFSDLQMRRLLGLANKGIRSLIRKQKDILKI